MKVTRSMNAKTATIWTLVIVFSFTTGFITRSSDNYFEISKNLDIFGKLYREVNSLYVDDIDPTDFMRKGIDAMLSSLDPYTNYISASEIEDFRFMSTGQYGGIGALIGKRDGKILILEPYKEKPADIAGLQAGDQLLTVDEEPIEGTEKNTMDVRNLLRGQPGTDVTISILREGIDKPLDIKITRDKIKIKNVPFYGMVNEDIGYISLTGFTQQAGKEVRDALTTLKSGNPGLKGVILDVRGNPGGLLQEAVNVSAVFIPQGEKVVETKGKMEGSQKDYPTRTAPVDAKIPLAVVANNRSASASEIVTGVIQDLDRGVVVGTRTFGKGLVQTTRPLSYNTQVKLTTAKYYIPSGRCIQAINYAERGEDGGVATIPDSLKKPFKTRSGRVVYDGGGIEPDIEVKQPKLKAVTAELNRKGLIFDFATKYVAGQEVTTGPKEFELAPGTYEKFVSYVKGKEFTFETQAEKQLEKLKDLVEEEDNFSSISASFTSLENNLAQQKENALNTHKEEISKLLKEEVIQRYFYREGLIEASFIEDPNIVEAVKILNDQEKYRKILAGN